jgi:hypothetical protein
VTLTWRSLWNVIATLWVHPNMRYRMGDQELAKIDFPMQQCVDAHSNR